MTAAVPALDIGGTHVSAALVDPGTWSVVTGSQCRRPLPPQGSAGEILDAILGCAATLPAADHSVWAVAIPGPFDYAAGVGRFAGVGKFEALHGVAVGQALRDGLGRRAARLEFLNDADAFLLGEWVAGAVAGHDRIVGLTLGTGVGSAFLADGAIVEHDPAVPPAGRVDLLTIDGLPLEDTVSRRAVLRRYRELVPAADPAVDIRELAGLAEAGDHVAGQVLDHALTALGRALAPWLSRFRATVLVVGGAWSTSWSACARPLRAGLAAVDPGLAQRIELTPASHQQQAPLIGAAWYTARRAGPPG